MSVARAQREIDSAEFTEWVARDQLPGIHSRTEALVGLLAAVIANVNRKPGTKPYVPEDFFAREVVDPGPLTNDQMMAAALLFQAKANAGLKH